MGIGLRIVPVTTEKQVVRPFFAKLQRLVARPDPTGSHRHFRLEARYRICQLRLAGLDMDTVRLHATGNARIASDNGGRARTLRSRNDLLCHLLEGHLVHPFLEKDDGGYVAAVQCGPHAQGIRSWPCQQHDTTTIGRHFIIHGLDSGSAYARRRWLQCGIEESATLEQRGAARSPSLVAGLDLYPVVCTPMCLPSRKLMWDEGAAL